ncbi:MAG: hypothetical protein KME29_16845 [Calothrix sp. FI2-JRJ7]|nr:hypothetical protein [Calothrix sp. FI2-JRJ7]
MISNSSSVSLLNANPPLVKPRCLNSLRLLLTKLIITLFDRAIVAAALKVTGAPSA